MGTLEQNNLEKHEDSKVDITKLTYTDDYNSYLGTKETAGTKRFNRLQYLRFMAIIAILELMLLDNFLHKDFVWTAVPLVMICVAIAIGKNLFESFQVFIKLVLLSTLISATLYYFKHN